MLDKVTLSVPSLEQEASRSLCDVTERPVTGAEWAGGPRSDVVGT